jgi:excisionase family DNA binding protein
MNTLENTTAPVNPSIDESAKHQNPPAPDDQLWTTEQVGKYLHVSLKTVFNLRKTGLPFLQLGGAVRFDPQEIKDYLAKNRRLASHGLRQTVRKSVNPL